MTPIFNHLSQVAPAKAAALQDKAALVWDNERISYVEFGDHVARVVNALVDEGVRAGDRVAFMARNTPYYYEVLLAVGTIGAVMVPVNWRLAAPEIEWIIADSGAVLLICGDEFLSACAPLMQKLPALRTVLTLDGDYVAWRDSHDAICPPVVDGNPDDVAVQMYTSGTTGRPKGAMLTHRGLLAFRSLPPEQQPEWNKWSDDDVSLIVMPQFHIGGTGFGLQTLCAGATGLIHKEFDAGKVLSAIAQEGLSKIFTVPSAIQMLIAHPQARSTDYSRIRTLIYGASPMPLDLLREAMAVFGCGFVQQYGMTEMCGTICALVPEDHDPAGNSRMESAGRALEGVEIRIVDPMGKAQPPGVVGEIAIRSVTCMKGYWNQPEATADAISADGFFRSGDAGMLDRDGYLTIVDRVKDMIVSGGENVYPAEVEAVLRSHPAIAEVAVIGVPDPKWGEAVKAVVVPLAGHRLDQAEVIGWARGQLAGYKLPKSIDLIAELPRNASGKVLRRELRAPYWEGRERAIG